MITDDIIRNKFHEILSSKDIEEQQNMGFNNIYKIKRYEFFRESFVKEFKALVEDPNTNISSVYNMAYCTVDKIARSPDTAIVKAICQGDYDLVDSMLTALNIDLNTEVYTLEGEAKSFLYFACHNNQKGIVRLLLAKGANIILDHNSGMTVFHTVLTAQHFDMAAFLIENGADPNYVTGDNMTYLEICTFLYLNIAMVTKLLTYGANMEFIRCEKTVFKSLVDLTRGLNDRKQSTDMVKVFLQYGANPDILDPDGQMVRNKEAICEPLKALLTLESSFRKNDYKKIKAIDKKDLAAFVQWKAAILPVAKDVSKDEYIKSLLELYKFSNQMSLDSDDSIKQPLIELGEKIAKLIPPLEFLCILKIEDIIDSNATDKIELLESAIKAMTGCRLLQVETTGETVAHNDLV